MGNKHVICLVPDGETKGRLSSFDPAKGVVQLQKRGQGDLLPLKVVGDLHFCHGQLYVQKGDIVFVRSDVVSDLLKKEVEIDGVKLLLVPIDNVMVTRHGE